MGPSGLNSARLTQRIAVRVFRAVESILDLTGFHDERTERYGALVRREIREGLGPQDIVLDLGCGLGGVTAQLVGPYTVVGVDLERSLLERFAEPTIPRVQALAEQLPLKPGSASAIVAISLVEHLPDRRRFLREVLRVLTPGGRCYLEIPELRAIFEPHTKWPLFFAMKPSFQEAILRGTGSAQLDMRTSAEEVSRLSEEEGLQTERVVPLWHFKIAKLLRMPTGHFVVLRKPEA